ncbi:hypothetical protein F5Y16DRAFT_425187 [Xylariaceae sp. FL0255]|nr:hypothetical protein F5Y16DRAFT_425187 [Xylariaceae sp. FL0255]
MFAITLFISLLAFAAHANATLWYFLRYYPASGQQFTSMSGDMAIPTLPGAGTYYLWPGLQPTDNSGVYQNVLDGRSGTWWIGSGWCCSNPTLAWGDGFNVYGGETIAFSNVRTNSTDWTSTLTLTSTGETVENAFALSDKSFNQAIFAIELDGVTWTFGQLAFSNIVITSTGSTDSSWCNASPENYDSTTIYSISGVSASASGTTVTCKIASLILEKPA